jgi:hypothetical protein
MSPHSDAWSEAYAAEKAALARAGRILLAVVGRDARDHDDQVREAIRYYRECDCRVRVYCGRFHGEGLFSDEDPFAIQDSVADELHEIPSKSVENGPRQQI